MSFKYLRSRVQDRNANPEFGAFEVGTYDDLVMPLVLAYLRDGLHASVWVEAFVIR